MSLNPFKKPEKTGRLNNGFQNAVIADIIDYETEGSERTQIPMTTQNYRQSARTQNVDSKIMATANPRMNGHHLAPPPMSGFSRTAQYESELDNVTDLADLPELNRNAILELLKRRFMKNQCYTNVGDILISINPYDELNIFTQEHHQKYSDGGHAVNQPHLFGTTERCYARMLRNDCRQTILISGESGSGKTYATQEVVRHISFLSRDSHHNLDDKLIKTNPLIEAFGNARTPLNGNSSRFAKCINIFFNNKGKLIGAEINEYMLEKSRIFQEKKGEKNFRILYYYMASMGELKFGLNTPETYRILQNHQGVVFETDQIRERLADEYIKIVQKMEQIGFSIEDITFIERVLAAIFHISSLEFESIDSSSDEIGIIEDNDEISHVSNLLQVSQSGLRKLFLYNHIHDPRYPNKPIVQNRTEENAEDTRDAIAKTLYHRLFGWIIKKINHYLNPGHINPRSCLSISILDMAGFEQLPTNGLEQLFINASNEKMQYFFNQYLFEQENRLYQENGIEIDMGQLKNTDNLIKLFMGYKRSAGMLRILDDVTKMPQLNEKDLVAQWGDLLCDNPHYHQLRDYRLGCGVIHSFNKRGTSEVKYQVEGMLKQNRDYVSAEVEQCFSSSQNVNIRKMFYESSHKTGSYSRATGLGALKEGSRRQNKTLAQSFLHSLDDLMWRLKQGECMFIRCIKPNGHERRREFDTNMVANQLKYSGLFELARIRQIGYPVHLPYDHFVQRYSLIKPYAKGSPEKKADAILREAGISKAEFGNDKIYLKEQHREHLEKILRHKKIRNEQEAEQRKKTKTREKWKRGIKKVMEGRKLRRNEADDEKKRQEEDMRRREEEDDLMKEKAKTWPWNRPREIPYERGDKTAEFKSYVRAIKLMLYVFLMIGVLFLLVSSKISLLSLATRINTSSDINEFKIKDMRQAGTSLMICLSAPYALHACLGFLKALFGGQPRPGILAFAAIMLVEACHAIGLCFLVFLVLPKLDMIRAILLMSTIGILPGLLKIFFATSPQIKNQDDEKKENIVSALKRSFSTKNPRRSVRHSFGRENRDKDMITSQVGTDEDRYNVMMSATWYLLNTLAIIIQIGTIVYVMLGKSFELTRVITNDEKSYFRATSLNRKVFSDMWHLPIGLIFVSIRYWENFVDKDVILFNGKLPLTFQKWKEAMHTYRQQTAYLGSALTVGIIIGFPYLMLENFKFDIYKKHSFKNTFPIIMQCLGSFVCYSFVLTACKLRMQRACVSLPLLLSTPISIILVYLHCTQNFSFLDEFVWFCPEGVVNKGHDRFSLSNNSYTQLICLLASWIAFIVICAHIWWPRQNVLDPSEMLFVTPMYNGALLEQTLLLNRRRRDRECRFSAGAFYWNIGAHYINRTLWMYMNEADQEEEDDSDDTVESRTEEKNVIPLIHACATLWHETQNEMEQLLKSVFRLDRNQNTRKNLRTIGYKDSNFYELQVHMFFDDAMVRNENRELVPNEYVHQFIGAINSAGSSVLECELKLEPPCRIVTPYGGRLEWTLPGGTKMYVHLKDKNKIRHKKRWSQVMYMYYLLGYQLLSRSDESVWREDAEASDEQAVKAKKNFFFSRSSFFQGLPEEVVLKAENTFLLALDGDVDFKPDALRLLMDLMKRNKNVGAACGRIHPIGSSPIVWYQMFEYAIAHWLQKAAEHVFGCVLCSPGCFSLFRGSAVMDDNVMRTYTKIASGPVEHVQYDQGEDRWLCTLLLKAGYRVEYSAAADALTYCPETFDEFYKQRRRWAPSTMANVLDLIGSFKETVTKNNNISGLFMVYQIFLFASSMIAPGTILLSLAGSYRVILSTSFVVSYILAVQPAVFYVLICMYCREKIQLAVAALMSAIYAVIMTVSIIGTLVSFLMGDALNPNLIFFGALVGFFLIAGLMHPQEFVCLLPAPMFFLCVPSGYLLLTIYSMCNLNNVSWGTREGNTPKTPEQKQKEEEEKKQRDAKKNRSFLEIIGVNRVFKEVKDMYSSLATSQQSTNSQTLSTLVDSVNTLTKTLQDSNPNVQKQTSEKKAISVTKPVTPPLVKPVTPLKPTMPTKPKTTIADITDKMKDNLTWLSKIKGDKKSLDSTERTFWENMIHIYLKPLDTNVEKQNQVKMELAGLRTFVVMGFCIINLLWIVITFLLQYLGEDDAIRKRLYVPLGPGDDAQRFEPFGMFFLVFFSIVLLLQFAASVAHRIGTLSHLLAVTGVVGKERSFDKMLTRIEEANNFNEADDRQMNSVENNHRLVKALAAKFRESPDAMDSQPMHKDRNPRVIVADHKDILSAQFRKKFGIKKLPNGKVDKHKRQTWLENASQMYGNRGHRRRTPRGGYNPTYNHGYQNPYHDQYRDYYQGYGQPNDQQYYPQDNYRHF